MEVASNGGAGNGGAGNGGAGNGGGSDGHARNGPPGLGTLSLCGTNPTSKAVAP
jgi:hypothetical protein